MILGTISSFFADNLIELLLGIILTFNIAAYKLVWDKIEEYSEEAEKNSESINMILNRIFGIEQDPTDEGHLVETEKRFEDINEKLDEIVEMQKQMEKERKGEHEKVSTALNSVIEKLSEEDNIDFEKEKLK